MRLPRLIVLPAVLLLAPQMLATVIADAGPDRTGRAREGCTGLMTLDAAESTVVSEFEPTYTWEGPFTEGGGKVTGKLVTVTLEEGVHRVRLTVTAGEESDTDEATLTVQDITVPNIVSVLPSKDVLWPPNHKMVPVALAIDVDDNCDQAPEC